LQVGIDPAAKMFFNWNHSGIGNKPTNIPCSTNFIDDDYVPNPHNYPFVTCQTYVIMEPKKNKLVFSKKADEVREMASLTKIMTCLVSLHLASELKLDINKTWFKVSKKAADTIGTSANLTENQRLTIIDLLYGLMLPSGNDAAVTLAENFTERLLQVRGKRKEV